MCDIPRALNPEHELSLSRDEQALLKLAGVNLRHEKIVRESELDRLIRVCWRSNLSHIALKLATLILAGKINSF